MLVDSRGVEFTSFVLRYFDELPKGLHPRQAHIVLPFQLEGLEVDLFGIVDTAAPWCLIQWSLLELLQMPPPNGRDRLETRFGLLTGELRRWSVLLFAEEGRPMKIDASLFVSEDWREERMPNFLGYEGFLQRLRFAIDPAHNSFHFGLAETDLSS